MSTAERRLSRRAITCFATLFSSGRVEGSGVLCDFSSTGARIEEATAKPSLDAQVILHIPLEGNDRSFETKGCVVRHTQSGFAVEFEKSPIDLQQLLEDAGAAALVIDEFPGSAPSEDPMDVDEKPSESFPVVGWPIEQCTLSELEALASQVSLEFEKKRELERKREEARSRVRVEVMRLADREGLSTLARKFDDVFSVSVMQPGGGLARLHRAWRAGGVDRGG